jgi:uncharacterized protein YlaN (UPF0358 family)
MKNLFKGLWSFFESLWTQFKNRGEILGLFLFLVPGFVLLVFRNNLAEVWLGFLAVGLGLVAIGMAAKADKRHTELLERLNISVERFPTLIKTDLLTVSGQQLAEEFLVKQGERRYVDVATRFELITEEQSKEEAQKRLDADTEKVGYVRGELYKRDDGSWAIHWGGKYPL